MICSRSGTSYLKSILLIAIVSSFLAVIPRPASGQDGSNWMSAGSLHNWYSEWGTEVERGLVQQTQYGMRWPGHLRLRDAQAGKSLWLGARNVQDPDGTAYDYRVVGAGPHRPPSDQTFEGIYPVEFTTVSRYPIPEVRVNGAVAGGETLGRADIVDPNLDADRRIITRINTQLGVTMDRVISQHSNPDHDNYHVIEYTFTNTGMAGPDDTVTLPDHTVEDFYVLLQWRWAVAAETRYVIGNATGWGQQTMIDRRGDGLDGDPDDEGFRAQFAWHGHFPQFGYYSPVGGPILPEALPAGNIMPHDTLGRLGASHFVGALTLHADRSAEDPSDEPAQPSTQTHFDSDMGLLVLRGGTTDEALMRRRYNELLTAGIRFPRHARMIEPSGEAGFVDPSNSPAMWTVGGYSAANGYGPYTLAPGESVRFVIVEAAAGLSEEANRDIGRQYQLAGANRDQAILEFEVDGRRHAMRKNEWVMTSRDSLFQTFRRAQEAYDSNWSIPAAPAPPARFNIDARVGAINLSWEAASAHPAPDSWSIYRATGSVHDHYEHIATVAGGTFEYLDSEVAYDRDYFYYIQAVDEASGLRSTRTAAQSHGAARPIAEVLHYWSFNDTTAGGWDFPLAADLGSGVLTHTFDPADVSITEGSDIFAVEDADAGAGLRIRANESHPEHLELSVSTEGYHSIGLRYAARWEVGGFRQHYVYEVPDEGGPELLSVPSLWGSGGYESVSISLARHAQLSDQTSLRLRIEPRFPSSPDGHNSIDNLSVVGVPFSANRPPQFTSILVDRSVVAGSTIRFRYAARDPEGAPVMYDLIEGPAAASLYMYSGELTWKPSPADVGATVRLEVGASDGESTVTTSALLTVIDRPDEDATIRFVTALPDTLIDDGARLSFRYQTSSDGPEAQLALLEGPEGARFDAVSGMLTWDASGPSIERIVVEAALEDEKVVADAVVGVRGAICDEAAGAKLRECLRESFAPAQVLGYTRALDSLYSRIDRDSDGHVHALYSGHSVPIFGDDAPRAIAFEGGITVDQVWPASVGAGNEPARSDLHHLFAAREEIRAARAGHTFQNVNTTTAGLWWLGDEELTEVPASERHRYSRMDNTGFEPRDAAKGIVARSLLYMYAMYDEVLAPTFWDDQSAVAVEWAGAFDPGGAEIRRSADVRELQGNLNPFVLDASLAPRMRMSGVNVEGAATPDVFALRQNYPNPFNPVTTIRFQLPEAVNVRLTVYDLLGRQLARLVDERYVAGIHEVRFDASALSSGIYLYVIEAGSFRQTKRMVLVK